LRDYIAGARRASGSPGSSVTAAPAATEAPAAPLLELVALGHEREGDRLIVRGVVRYATGTDPANLTAVASVLNRQGDIVATGRGLVTGAKPTATGVESSFVVTVPGVSDVSRYRVGFKSNERIIAHRFGALTPEAFARGSAARPSQAAPFPFT